MTLFRGNSNQRCTQQWRRQPTEDKRKSAQSTIHSRPATVVKMKDLGTDYTLSEFLVLVKRYVLPLVFMNDSILK
jgi:hypothetical protein